MLPGGELFLPFVLNRLELPEAVSTPGGACGRQERQKQPEGEETTPPKPERRLRVGDFLKYWAPAPSQLPSMGRGPRAQL